MSARAPSPYGCRAIAFAVGIVPVAFVAALYGVAEAIAHTWNPFL